MSATQRLRYNGLTCTGSPPTLGASLTSGGTTITFPSKLQYQGGTDVPTIADPTYLPIVIDSDSGTTEIVWLTAYTTGATTGTILRGQEGTTGVAHSNGAPLRHGPTAQDAAGAPQQATVATAETTTSTSFTDLTTSGPAVTVNIGPSGSALVTVTCAHSNSGGWNGDMGFAVSGASTVAATATRCVSTNRATPAQQASATYLVTGLTAGSNTFTAKYETGSSGSTSTFSNRNILVIPI